MCTTEGSTGTPCTAFLPTFNASEARRERNCWKGKYYVYTWVRIRCSKLTVVEHMQISIRSTQMNTRLATKPYPKDHQTRNWEASKSKSMSIPNLPSRIRNILHLYLLYLHSEYTSGNIDFFSSLSKSKFSWLTMVNNNVKFGLDDPKNKRKDETKKCSA